MKAARKNAQKLIDNERYEDLPTAIYISSDSVEIADYIEETCSEVRAYVCVDLYVHIYIYILRIFLYIFIYINVYIFIGYI
jgi:hypothetical protein